MQLIEITDRLIWDEFVSKSPFGHPLQLWAWGEVKKKNGWQPVRLGAQSGTDLEVAAQILFWNIPKTPFKLAYIPRGPVIDPSDANLSALLEAVALEAKKRGAIQLKLEAAWQGVELPGGWKRASDNVLLAETYIVDLNRSEEEIEAAIDSKARYYVRKAERDGVKIRRVTDTEGLQKVLQVYKSTAERAHFALHSDEYYQALLQEGGEANHIFLAEKGSEPLAFVWVLAGGDTAFELYGGMTPEGGKLHGSYALKSHAILQMKSLGYAKYDFNGRLNDGVTKFKSVWGADETDWIGSYNLPLRQPHYTLWQVLWPLGKKLSKLVRR